MGAYIAGAAIGAIGNAISTAKANKASKQLAREQMAFQRKMSNTAFQRASADLEKAGLNRILALGSPASTPGGASATMQATDIAGAASKMGTAALQKVRQKQELKNMAAQEAQAKAATTKEIANASMATQSARESAARQHEIEMRYPELINRMQYFSSPEGKLIHKMGMAHEQVPYLGPAAQGVGKDALENTAKKLAAPPRQSHSPGNPPPGAENWHPYKGLWEKFKSWRDDFNKRNARKGK